MRSWPMGEVPDASMMPGSRAGCGSGCGSMPGSGADSVVAGDGAGDASPECHVGMPTAGAAAGAGWTGADAADAGLDDGDGTLAARRDVPNAGRFGAATDLRRISSHTSAATTSSAPIAHGQIAIDSCAARVPAS